MKKLHSLAFYALAAPLLTLGAGSVLAQSSADTKSDYEKQSSQGSMQSAPKGTGDQGTERAKPYSSPMAADRQHMGDQSRAQNRGYISAAPTNGMQASNLIGAEVKTTGDEEVGSVSDLIIDENGQVVAIVIGVGGFLGMGEREVAIGWDDVTRSGSADEQELRITQTREQLSAAPAFKKQD